MNLSEAQLQKLTHDVELLEVLLEREKEALSNPSGELDYDISGQKQDLLNSLATCGLNEYSVADLGVETVRALWRCRDLNHENNLLVNQKLKVLRQINAIYRQHLGHNPVTLYDQLGRMVHGATHRTVTEV